MLMLDHALAFQRYCLLSLQLGPHLLHLQINLREPALELRKRFLMAAFHAQSQHFGPRSLRVFFGAFRTPVVGLGEAKVRRHRSWWRPLWRPRLHVTREIIVSVHEDWAAELAPTVARRCPVPCRVE